MPRSVNTRGATGTRTLTPLGEGTLAYDEGLLERCLDALRDAGAGMVRHKAAFGTRGLLVGRKMFAAVAEESLLVKVSAEEYDGALDRPGVRPFDPGGGGRGMGTWLEVAAEGVADEPQLREWLTAGLRGIGARRGRG